MDPQHEPPQTSNPLVVRLKKNRITDHEGEKKSPNDLVIDLPSEPDLNQRHRDAELIQSQKNRITELENEHQRDAELIQWQKSRITKLDDEIKAYEDLLAELPEVFERSFQQRLEPLMERYQLLAEQVDTDQIERSQPALPGSSEPDNAVRFPGLRLLNFLQKRQRSA